MKSSSVLRRLVFFCSTAAFWTAPPATGTPATPATVWRTSQSHPSPSAPSSSSLVAYAARMLVDGSLLVARVEGTSLTMTRLGDAGSVLSTFTVRVPSSYYYYTMPSVLLTATGEVYTATQVSGCAISKFDAFSGIRLWPAGMTVDEISNGRLVLDPAGDVVVAGYSRWGSGLVFTKLNRFDGAFEMGPILLGIEYGNFADVVVDPSGDVVVAGSLEKYGSAGYSYSKVVGRFSGQSGLQVWGGSVFTSNSYLTRLRMTPSGSVYVSSGKYVACLSGGSGSPLLGPTEIGSDSTLLDVDGAGSAYFLISSSSGLFATRVSAERGIVWKVPVSAPVLTAAGGAADGAGNLALFSNGTATLLAHDSGQILWERIIISASPTAYVALLHPTGDFIAVGTTTSWSEVGRYAHDDGSALWASAAQTGMSSNDVWTSVAVDASGDVLLAGTSGISPQMQVLVRKENGRTGETIWGPVPVGSPTNSAGPLFAVDPSGNPVVSGIGSTLSLYGLSGSDGSLRWGPAALSSSGSTVDIAFDGAGDLFHLSSSADSSGKHSFSLVKRSGATGGTLWTASWSSTAAIDDVPTSLRLDASGNAIVAGTSKLAVNGSSRAVLLEFSGAAGVLLWGPREYDDFGQTVGRVVVSRDAVGTLFLTTLSGSYSWSGYPVQLRKLDASGSVIWGPIAPLLPAPDRYSLQTWCQAADPAGDLLVGFQQSSMTAAKLRAGDGSVAWYVSAGSGYGSTELRVDADGNIAFSSAGSYGSVVQRLSGADGAPLWSPLLSTNPVSVSSLQRIALHGRDLVLAGGDGGAATATRVGGGVGIPAIDDGLLVAACGEPFSYDLAAVNGREPFFWSVVSGALPPGVALSSGGQIAGSASGEGTFRFRVQVTDADDATAVRDLAVTVVDAQPMVAIQASPSAPCQGETVSLSAPGGWTSYEWLPGGQGTSTLDVVVSQPSTFGVAVTDASGCARHGSITLFARPFTLPPVISAPDSAPANNGGFTASAVPHAGSTYAWTLSAGTITAGQGTNQITFSTGSAGTMTIGVRETAAGSCASQEATVTMAVHPGTGFYPIAPCRVLDTRNPVGPSGGPSLASGATRVVTVAGACGIPADARALAVNLTSVVPLASGDLRFGPGDLPPSALGSVPLVTGRIRAVSNVLGVSSDGSGTVAFSNASAANVDVLLDVSGYFR